MNHERKSEISPEQRSWHGRVAAPDGGWVVRGGGHKCAVVAPAVTGTMLTRIILKKKATKPVQWCVRGTGRSSQGVGFLLPHHLDSQN